MSTANSSSDPSVSDLIYALNDPSRWRILKELSSGESRLVSELMGVTRKSLSATSKHVAALASVGLIESHRRAYRLAPRFVPRSNPNELDFGVCVIRLDRF